MRELPAYRRAARTLPCPRCGAVSGAPCRAPSGRSTSEHGVRYNLTRAAQNIGYEEGLRDALSLIDWKGGEVDEAALALVREPVQVQYDMVLRHNRRVAEELSSTPASGAQS